MSVTNSGANAATATSAITATGSASAGFMGWIDSNTALIGVSIAMVSLLVGLYFHIQNRRINKEMLKIREEDARIKKQDSKIKNATMIAVQISKWRDEGKTEQDIKDLMLEVGLEDYAS